MNDTILAALLGSLITAFSAIIFTKYQGFKDKNEERIAVLNALQSELSSLQYLICSREEDFKEYDPSGLPEGSLPYISITLNYFNVFEGLSAKFGLITQPKLASNIIRTYMETKGLFENVKDLEYFAKQAHKLMIEPPKDPELIPLLIGFHNSYKAFLLTEHVPSVKKQILTCINDIDEEKERISSKDTIWGFVKHFFR